MDAGFSASQLLPAGPPGLVLPGDRADSISSDAFPAITAGPRWRCPFGVLMAVETPTRTHRRRTPPASSPTFPTLCSSSLSQFLCVVALRRRFVVERQPSRRSRAQWLRWQRGHRRHHRPPADL